MVSYSSFDLGPFDGEASRDPIRSCHPADDALVIELYRLRHVGEEAGLIRHFSGSEAAMTVSDVTRNCFESFVAIARPEGS